MFHVYVMNQKMHYFYSKINQMHQCIKFIYFRMDSTGFGRSFRPSSGVQDCTYKQTDTAV